MDVADIPAEAPQDAIMASPAEEQALFDWAGVAFGDTMPSERAAAVRVELRRQDHSVLRFGQSCIETPIQIGQQEFRRGLGTHANSEIILHLPPGARTFQASVGIDNNFDTGGQRGSGQFSVEIGGKELFRTATLKGGDAAAPVRVDPAPVPHGCRRAWRRRV